MNGNGDTGTWRVGQCRRPRNAGVNENMFSSQTQANTAAFDLNCFRKGLAVSRAGRDPAYNSNSAQHAECRDAKIHPQHISAAPRPLYQRRTPGRPERLGGLPGGGWPGAAGGRQCVSAATPAGSHASTSGHGVIGDPSAGTAGTAGTACLALRWLGA